MCGREEKGAMSSGEKHREGIKDTFLKQSDRFVGSHSIYYYLKCA